MTSLELHATACPICGPAAGAAEIYAARFDEAMLTSATFSARRIPDGQHFRIVRCQSCGLLRSDPAASPDALAALYRDSAMTYADEVANLRKTYGRYLARLRHRGSLLEIGCGNGFFLEEARRQGYHVQGIEPSEEARSRAAEDVRGRIVSGIFRAGVFDGDSFDVIAAFQVLDHLSDPIDVLEECRRILKPGGLILMLHHNAGAMSAKVLGERSPIIDIEHTFLYTPETMRALLSKTRFEVLHIGAAINRLSLGQLASLLPLPSALKNKVLAFLRVSGARRIPIVLPLGNLVAVARKNDP